MDLIWVRMRAKICSFCGNTILGDWRFVGVGQCGGGIYNNVCRLSGVV